LIPVSSLLGTSSGFIFLLFLGNEFPEKRPSKIKFRSYFYKNLKKKNSLLKALLLFVIFMAQPLYSFIYLCLYLGFLLYLYIYRERIDKGKVYTTKVGFVPYFTKILCFICLFILVIIPYIVGLSIYLDYLILETYIRYAIPEFDISLIKFFVEIIPRVSHIFTLNFTENSYFSLISKIYYQTMDYGLIIIIIGLFFPFNKIFKINESQKNVLRFIKISFIFTFFIFSLNYLMRFINIGIVRTTNVFLEEYSFRILELFSGYWILLFVLVLKFIFIKSKKYYKKKKINEIAQKYNLKLIPAILLIITGGYFYFINFIRISPNLYFNDSQTEALQYVGNYFYENPVRENTSILLEDLGNNHIYDLIMDKNLNKEFFNYTQNTTYSDFYFNAILRHQLRYIFLNLDGLSPSFIETLRKDLNILYIDNNNFLFAEIKVEIPHYLVNLRSIP